MVCTEGTTRPDGNSPCPWDFQIDCDDCWDDYPQEIKDRAVQMATALLWRRTGRQFGCCCITIRPCRESCCDPCEGLSDFSSGHPWTPAFIDGQWFNLKCRTCKGRCSCSEVCEVILPGPVCDIHEVKIDGIPLIDVEYRVDNHNRLVRVPWTHRSYSIGEQSGQNRYDYPAEGMWTAFFAGWGTGVNNPELPTSLGTNGNPDLGQVHWPGAASGARGQFIRLWVPPLATLTIVTPERGVTIWQTPDTESNGVADDAAGIYKGFAEGSEFLIRFDGDQTVSFETEDTGVEVREVGWMVLGTQDRCWPTCQEMGLPDTEPGTWSVSYSMGAAPPTDAKWIVGRLAVEFAKACVGDKDCQLPRRVQTLTRQGVSVQFLDDGSFLEHGLTGIMEVDQWITSVNPYGLQEPSRVFSVDNLLHDFRRETWPNA